MVCAELHFEPLSGSQQGAGPSRTETRSLRASTTTSGRDRLRRLHSRLSHLRPCMTRCRERPQGGRKPAREALVRATSRAPGLAARHRGVSARRQERPLATPPRRCTESAPADHFGRDPHRHHMGLGPTPTPASTLPTAPSSATLEAAGRPLLSTFGSDFTPPHDGSRRPAPNTTDSADS